MIVTFGKLPTPSSNIRTGTSTTLINNNVSVIALTGNNRVTDANTALISTGNAYAGANIVNVANSNVIYYLEYVTNPVPPTVWTTLTSTPGTGAQTTLSDSNPSGLQRFYRIRVQ